MVGRIYKRDPTLESLISSTREARGFGNNKLSIDLQALPSQLKIELSLQPVEYQLYWLANRMTQQVLGSRLLLKDENAPEYIHLRNRIVKALLDDPVQVNKLKLILSSL